MTNYCKEVTTAYYDCDINNRLKLSGALRYMQQASGEQCASVGQSAEKLYREGLVFLLVKTNLKIERMPVSSEEITIITAAASVKGPRFIREFSIDTRGGERLISAYSLWVLADVNSHRILRPGSYPYELPIGAVGIDGIVTDIPIPKRSELPSGAQTETSELAVRYSHLDINRHVNNSYYADMVCDALPIDLMSEGKVKTLVLSFQSEAKAGDTVKIETVRLSRDAWKVSGTHERGSCFDSLIEVEL